jgi:squalene cyclase
MSLSYCWDFIKYEDISTNFLNVGPVNKAWNMLCCIFTEGNDSDHLKKHLDTCQYFYWLSKDGMKCSGQVGSQFWDAGFALQAFYSTGIFHDYEKMVHKTFHFIENNQSLENPKDFKKYFRHEQVGGFPFTCKVQNWIVSDCTAEGIKCVLQSKKLIGKSISDERIHSNIDIILSLQNSTGGTLFFHF